MGEQTGSDCAIEAEDFPPPTVGGGGLGFLGFRVSGLGFRV